jgi:hypothetical protein
MENMSNVKEEGRDKPLKKKLKEIIDRTGAQNRLLKKLLEEINKQNQQIKHYK